MNRWCLRSAHPTQFRSLLPACHTLLTIRYLTRCGWRIRSGMQIIKIKRTVRTNNPVKLPGKRPFLQFAQSFFDKENHLEFIIEAVLFGALLAVSAWPIIAAAGAINAILRTAA